MDLATQQRKLLGLFRSTYELKPDEDDYIRAVAGSPDLVEGRRNIFLWRVFVMERTCALTFALLKRCDLLDGSLEAFISRHNISPYRETQGPAFLEFVGERHGGLVASVAQFELALTRVKEGDAGRYEILWSVDPHVALLSLARDLPFDRELHAGTYKTIVSRDLPFQFEIVAGSCEPRPSWSGPGAVTQERPDYSAASA